MNRKYVILLSTVFFAVVTSLLLSNGDRLIGYDGFYYVKYAKELSESWPTRVGNLRAYGYPFVSSLISRMGVPTYFSMVAVSFLSLVFSLGLSISLIPAKVRRHWSTIAVFCALGAAPVAGRFLIYPWSEWLFTAMLTSTAVQLLYWPKRWAVWGSVATALCAFCVRYAGIFLLGVMGLHGIWHVRSLRNEGKLPRVVGALSVVSVAVLGLLSLNVIQTGHLSGGARPPGGGLTIVPTQAAHLGWGVVRSVTGQLPVARVFGGIESVGGLVFGWAVLVVVLGLCARPFLPGGERKLRAISMVAVAYLLSMIVFRSISEFVDLSDSRFVLPVLPLAATLLVHQIDGWGRTVVGAGAIGALAIALFFASEVGIRKTNVSVGKRVLNGQLTTTDTVLVNGQAKRLAVYYEAQFLWDRSSTVRELLSSVRSQAVDYGVFLAPWSNGYGGEMRNPLQKPYRQFCKKAEALAEVEKVASSRLGCVVRMK